MTDRNSPPPCPECDGTFRLPAVPRRDFLRAAALTVGSGLLPAVARAAEAKPAAKPMKPAEALVRELFADLSAEQKRDLVLPWDHGTKDGKGTPTRLGMYNRPIGKPIADLYTPAQRELLERILKAICADDQGYARVSRNGTFDGSGSFGGIGATLFGDPADGKQFSLVFAGHHLTVRCDGNSEPGAAFGGPMYYGHSPNGYSPKNVFHYQTERVMGVYDALSADQRKVASAPGNPGEQAGSVQFRKPGDKHPGLPVRELKGDQKELVQAVMRDLLSPFRKEDADEVMTLVTGNGGLDAVHLAFYADGAMNDKQPWHFWRLEGPGFVWNFRVLPHVHTFVNIAAKG